MQFLGQVLFLFISAPLVRPSAVGHSTCVGGYLHPDADLEKTMGFKCPPDISMMDKLTKVTSDDEGHKIMAALAAPQWKCVFGLYKAIDDKGKLIATVASEKFFEGVPAAAKKDAKKKLDACITTHNPKIKKETKATTWVDFSLCFNKMIESNPCNVH